MEDANLSDHQALTYKKENPRQLITQGLRICEETERESMEWGKFSETKGVKRY